MKVPIICSEPWLFDDLGMTGAVKFADFGRTKKQKNIIIADSRNPLAGTLAGQVQVTSKSFYMGWGTPGENAIRVAALPADADKCPVFAYESGAAMPGRIAPARRIGFFMFKNTAKYFTSEGWALYNSVRKIRIVPLLPPDLRENELLKNSIRVIKKKNLYYLAESETRLKRFKPWLGDSFSFLYDVIMAKSIFPKKFGGNIQRHDQILSQALEGIHGQRVLELATGSGSAVNFLPNDNTYIGTDISPGLLRKAVVRFQAAGFKEIEFYVTDAEDLPFDEKTFSICLCVLALNFFDDIKKVL